jgi:hypothetical protein
MYGCEIDLRFVTDELGNLEPVKGMMVLFSFYVADLRGFLGIGGPVG